MAGEITSAYEPDVFAVVRKVLSDIGYSSEGIAMDTFVHQQSPDIAGAVDTSKERREGVSDNQMDWFQGAGDQGVMIGYACDETKQLMPIPVVLANRIVRELSACRQSSYIQGILPDGKAQVTVEYENGKPVRLDSVVVSCQHTEDKNLKKLEAEIRKKVLLPALRLLPPDEDTKFYQSIRSFCLRRHGCRYGTDRKEVDGRQLWQHGSPWRRSIFWERLFKSRPFGSVYGQIHCQEHCRCETCQQMSGVFGLCIGLPSRSWCRWILLEQEKSVRMTVLQRRSHWCSP